MSVRKNESKRSPVITAPSKLVAANSTARSTIERRTVAIIAQSNTVRILLAQQGNLLSQQLTEAEVASAMSVAAGAWASCPKQSGVNSSGEKGYVFYDGNAKGYYYLYFYKEKIGPGGYYISNIK